MQELNVFEIEEVSGAGVLGRWGERALAAYALYAFDEFMTGWNSVN